MAGMRISKEDEIIIKDLDDLKEINEECNLSVFVGYSKQYMFPAEFNLVKEKKGFIKIKGRISQTQSLIKLQALFKITKI